MTVVEKFEAHPGRAVSSQNRGRRLVAVIFVAAFAIRVGLIFYLDTWHIQAAGDHWSFGFESGRIARSLAEGKGFASPFQEPTGPTAWLAPGYPWLLSLVFRVFGVFTPASAMAALFINAILSSLTCLAIYHAGRKFSGETAGLIGAALFALSPAAVWHTINTVWDATVSALLISLLIYFLARLHSNHGLKLGLAIGFIGGLLVLFNPACLSIYLAGIAYSLMGHMANRSLTRVLAVLVIVPLLIAIPWVVRNRIVLDVWNIKSNFGTELRIGNNPLAESSPAAAVMDLHPAVAEFGFYCKLGEAGYVAWCRQQAISFIRSHPGVFLRLAARRVLIFWTGAEDNDWAGNMKTAGKLSAAKRLIMAVWTVLALLGLLAVRRSAHQTLFLLILALYPVPYYLTHCTNRYRMSLEPVLAILAAQALIWMWRRYRSRFPCRADTARTSA